MNFLLHLWYSFLALPMWGHVIAGGLVLGGLLWGFIKKKAIGAGWSTIWKKCGESFWRWMGKKMVLPQHTPPSTGNQQKTYYGTFLAYSNTNTFPMTGFFAISGNGFTTRVSVHPTQLLSDVRQGSLVEIDTEVVAGSPVELVRRVRIDEGA